MKHIELVKAIREARIPTPKPAHQMKTTDLLDIWERHQNGEEFTRDTTPTNVVEEQLPKRKGRPSTKTPVNTTSSDSPIEKQERRGRPTDPNSPRQLRLAELEAKRAAGELKRGRPTDLNSPRQLRLAELEAKRKAGELKRGRPSLKQQTTEVDINEDISTDVETTVLV